MKTSFQSKPNLFFLQGAWVVSERKEECNTEWRPRIADSTAFWTGRGKKMSVHSINVSTFTAILYRNDPCTRKTKKKITKADSASCSLYFFSSNFFVHVALKQSISKHSLTLLYKCELFLVPVWRIHNLVFLISLFLRKFLVAWMENVPTGLTSCYKYKKNTSYMHLQGR